MANTPFSPGLLPADNPISQWVSPRRNALLGFGAGMLSPGLSGAATGAMQGMTLDRQYADEAAKTAKEAGEETQTTAWLKTNYPQYSNLPTSQAWELAMKDEAAKRASLDPTADQQNYKFYANEEIKAGRAPVSFMEFSNPQSAPSLPASYQEYQLGLKDPGFAASQAPVPKGPTEAAARAGGLLQVVQPDAALLLGDGTTNNPGIFDRLANGGDQNWSNFGVDVAGVGIHPLTFAASPEYRQAKDAVTNIVQQYMYVTSGATAPEPEVRRNALAVTPQPTDSPEQLADKKRRLGDMVKAMQGIADPSAGNAGDGWEVVGVQ